MDDPRQDLTPAEAVEHARRRLLERDRLREERDSLMVRRAIEPDNDAALATRARWITGRLEEYATAEEDLAAAERRAETERVRATGGVHGQRRAEIVQQLDALHRKEQVLREVLERAQEVSENLLRAEQRLGSATTMGILDTATGGGLGLLPSLWVDNAKYARIDEAVLLLRRAQSSLRLLSQSQGIEVFAALQGLDLGELHRSFDVFLDNPLSDVRTVLKLRASLEQVRAVQPVVSGIVTRLNLDLLLVEQDRDALELERAGLD